MKNQIYYIAHKQFKQAIKGEIIEHNERSYGINKVINKWNVTDIATGMSINQDRYKTRVEAIGYLNGFDLDMNNKTIKQGITKAEKFFAELPKYDEATVYFNHSEMKDNDTSYHTGEYKGHSFEITVNFDNIMSNGMSIDSFKSKNSTDFSDQEVEFIADEAINERCNIIA